MRVIVGTLNFRARLFAIAALVSKKSDRLIPDNRWQLTDQSVARPYLACRVRE